MERKIKVLLLVSEAWRLDTSGGNTINNFFEGMEGVEFAQIYCDNKTPNNTVCWKYYQITEQEVVRNMFLHKPVGKELFPNSVETQPKKLTNVHGFNNIKKKIISWHPECLLFTKRLIWQISNWRTNELEKFIIDFNPDVIYAPCYAFPFQLSLTRYVKQLTGCKIITWSADDSYSLRQFNWDPFFWINRFWDRHCLRKTYPYYEEFYSISEDEIEEMSPIVGKQMKLLRKGVHVPDTFVARDVNQPVRFIYAGGLYLQRYKILIEIAKAIKDLNKDGIKAELHIYTGSYLKEKYAKLLNDQRNVFNHGIVSGIELETIYKTSDVAIHCESFDRTYRLITRLSFSTKIIDCFQSGCAILAIAWKEHTGLKYLKNEDAALCITDIKDIKSMISRIILNPEIIKEYAHKSYECAKKNHKMEDIQQMLLDCFIRNSKHK